MTTWPNDLPGQQLHRLFQVLQHHYDQTTNHHYTSHHEHGRHNWTTKWWRVWRGRATAMGGSRHDTSRAPGIFSFFTFPFFFLLISIYLWVYVCQYQHQHPCPLTLVNYIFFIRFEDDDDDEVPRPANHKGKGPNDVWALGFFFLSFYLLLMFLLYIFTMTNNKPPPTRPMAPNSHHNGHNGHHQTTNGPQCPWKGPNDIYRHLGRKFFFLLLTFIIFNFRFLIHQDKQAATPMKKGPLTITNSYVTRQHHTSITTMAAAAGTTSLPPPNHQDNGWSNDRPKEGSDNENAPKRWALNRCIFFFLPCFYILTICTIVLSIYFLKYEEGYGGRRRRKRAIGTILFFFCLFD